jgi:hypothetical protein
MEAYLSGNADQTVIDKVQYRLNYNTYENQVNAARAAKLQALQNDALRWAETTNQDGQTTINAVNVLWTSLVNQAYDAAAQAGTDTSNVSVMLANKWCANFQDSPSCFTWVKTVQNDVNGSLGKLASSKAALGVNMPYTPPPPPTKGSLAFAPAAQAARSSRRLHGLRTIVIAASKKVTLKPGKRGTIRLKIPAVVRAELRRARTRGKRTLRAHLVVQLSTSTGAYTVRTIPVNIRLTAAPKTRRRR